MLILLDHNVPRPLRLVLKGHLVRTSEQRGWKDLENGALLDAAERAGFDLLVTADQNLQYQQNLSARVIALIVLGSAQWPRVREHLPKVVEAVNAAQQNSYCYIAMPMPPKPFRKTSNSSVVKS